MLPRTKECVYVTDPSYGNTVIYNDLEMPSHLTVLHKVCLDSLEDLSCTEMNKKYVKWTHHLKNINRFTNIYLYQNQLIYYQLSMNRDKLGLVLNPIGDLEERDDIFLFFYHIIPYRSST